MDHSRITAVHPKRAVEGGRISVLGTGFPVDGPRLPEVRIGDAPARVVVASSDRLDVIVPLGFARSGAVPVSLQGQSHNGTVVEVATRFATDLHQVDNPVFGRDGSL